VVPKSSAVVPGAINAEPIAIMANHHEMVKYLGDDVEAFRKVSGHIQVMVEEANDKVQKNWDTEERLKKGMISPA
jgi:hypothetical protein